MADAESRKLLADPWAATGDREDPEAVGLSRARGWGPAYEQIGSGSEPERTVFNQRLRELDGWAADRMRQGIPTWDAEVDYLRHAFVPGDDGLYVSTVATGPATGNPTDPMTPGQTVWRRY